jgi:hypothetical protein
MLRATFGSPLWDAVPEFLRCLSTLVFLNMWKRIPLMCKIRISQDARTDTGEAMTAIRAFMFIVSAKWSICMIFQHHFNHNSNNRHLCCFYLFNHNSNNRHQEQGNRAAHELAQLALRSNYNSAVWRIVVPVCINQIIAQGFNMNNEQ